MTENFPDFNISKEPQEKECHNAEETLWEAFQALTYSGLVYIGGHTAGKNSNPNSKVNQYLEGKRKELLDQQKPYNPSYADTGSRMVKGKEPSMITRSELLQLTGLPDDFILDPLPEFPSVDEVNKLIEERTSDLDEGEEEEEQFTEKFLTRLKNLPYPRMVCDIILQASSYHALGFNSERYEVFIKRLKSQHEIISRILQQK